MRVAERIRQRWTPRQTAPLYSYIDSEACWNQGAKKVFKKASPADLGVLSFFSECCFSTVTPQISDCSRCKMVQMMTYAAPACEEPSRRG